VAVASRPKLTEPKGNISVNIPIVSIAAIQFSLLEALLSVLPALRALVEETAAERPPKSAKDPTAIQIHFSTGDSRCLRKKSVLHLILGTYEPN
jgi:hypothetical protein